ncbi:MAG: D-alanyl-D-alanine carboxypeptidase [Lachnospiraceae bacterium]|nr:D-alanyl-D-alanine carboxypeptidase [Lachnospiraceae bacterium]
MKRRVRYIVLVLCMVTALFFTGCYVRNDIFLKKYNGIIGANNNYALISLQADERIDGYAEEIVVVPKDYSEETGAELSNASASLYCLDDKSIIYADNVHESLHPASLTKIMTVYVALKYGNLDDIVTITDASKITERGATTIGLETGDKISLRDLVYCSLIYSGNDAAAAIAVHISGSVEEYAKLMTKEAAALGATNTTFKNPHGLTEEGHMTTVYDVYLMLNEAIKNETVIDMINRTNYTYTYTKANGDEKTKTVKSTLRYFFNQYEYPSDITIIGGKTGTTNAAGYCLALYVTHKDSGKQYIAVVLKASSLDNLYSEMSYLLEFCE